jgi:hypothetical protein
MKVVDRFDVCQMLGVTSAQFSKRAIRHSRVRSGSTRLAVLWASDEVHAFKRRMVKGRCPGWKMPDAFYHAPPDLRMRGKQDEC